MREYLWQYVLMVDPFATEEDVIDIIELNEWDLLIKFKNGRKILYDRFTKYYKNIYYDDIFSITEEQEMREFSSRLRSLMGRRRITQQELAEKIKTTQAMISRYVRGETIPSVLIARKIAKTLGYSLDDFFDKDY